MKPGLLRLEKPTATEPVVRSAPSATDILAPLRNAPSPSKPMAAHLHRRFVDEAGDDAGFFDKRDDDGPGRNAGDEICRAVYRIDHPDVVVLAHFGAVLLAKDAILRKGGCDPAADMLFQSALSASGTQILVSLRSTCNVFRSVK